MKRPVVVLRLTVAFAMIGTVALTGRATIAHASSAGSSAIQSGSLLTNTLLGTSTQVDQVDMLSPTLGYALATRYLGHSRYRYYLVRTTNLARTWTIRSEIPSDDDRYPIYTDFGAVDSDQMIDFVNRNVGYVIGRGDDLYVTDNGGSTWKRVETNYPYSGYGVSGSTMSLVTAKCHTSSTSSSPKCAYELNGYVVGSPVPEYSRPIPDVNVKYPSAAALLAVAPDSTDIVNLSNDVWATRSSLIVTHDDGQTWAGIPNPCTGELIEQMAVASDGEWLLSCFLDEGSYHGTAKIFRSTDDGVTWATVLDDSALRDIKGNLGGTPAYFFFSGNDRVLFTALQNPAGGLSVSNDGGTDWTPDTALGNTGSNPGSLSVFGPTSSIYQVWQGPMYVTNNNRTWRILPQLPAGLYKGLSICTSKDTTLSLRRVKTGGLRYTYVDFTNDGAASCYLDGAPTLQLLGAGSVPIGEDVGSELFVANGDFVVLKPNGGVADVPFYVNPASTYKPTSTCDAKSAVALRIDFGAPSNFVLSLSKHPILACSKLPNVNLDALRPGPGKP